MRGEGNLDPQSEEHRTSRTSKEDAGDLAQDTVQDQERATPSPCTPISASSDRDDTIVLIQIIYCRPW